jgi:hypothetical protein
VITSLGCACLVLQRWAVDCPSCCKGQLQPDGTDGTVVGGVHHGRCSSAWSRAPDGVRGILHRNTPARQQKPPHGSGARQARSRCQPRATRGASTRRAAAPLAGAGHATEILEDCRPMRSRAETGVAGRAEPTTGCGRPGRNVSRLAVRSHEECVQRPSCRLETDDLMASRRARKAATPATGRVWARRDRRAANVWSWMAAM